MKDKRILVECAASDHVLVLHLDGDEHLVYLSVYVGEFYAQQRSFLGRVWRRLCIIGTVMLGREYQFEDVVLDREATADLRDFLANPVAAARDESAAP